MSRSLGVPSAPAAPFAAVARVALVGDRSAEIVAHGRIPDLLDALRRRDGLPVDAYWIPTSEVAAAGAFDGFDGIWLVPGSPYASEAGALAAVRAARERGIPFLGTCGGLQHVVLEFARSVCGFAHAAHAEVDPDAPHPLIVPIACALNGHEGAVRITRDSLAERVIGADRTVERYYCSTTAPTGSIRTTSACCSSTACGSAGWTSPATSASSNCPATPSFWRRCSSRSSARTPATRTRSSGALPRPPWRWPRPAARRRGPRRDRWAELAPAPRCSVPDVLPGRVLVAAGWG
nr:hypothetical protein [Frankia gtarii]